jgi:hypothetical protein
MQILEAICDVKDIDKDVFLRNKKSRVSHIQEVKQLACLLGQREGYSQEEIGRFLNLDHSTVCLNKKRAEGYCSYDKEYASDVYKIQERFLFKESNTPPHKDEVLCCECEAFKNYEQKEKSFALGFYCPIKQTFVFRDNFSCEWIVSDDLNF